MGQVSVLVSVFGGETVNQNMDHNLWRMMIMIIIIMD